VCLRARLVGEGGARKRPVFVVSLSNRVEGAAVARIDTELVRLRLERGADTDETEDAAERLRETGRGVGGVGVEGERWREGGVVGTDGVVGTVGGEGTANCARHASMRVTLLASASLACISSSSSPSAALEQYDAASSSS